MPRLLFFIVVCTELHIVFSKDLRGERSDVGSLWPDETGSTSHPSQQHFNGGPRLASGTTSPLHPIFTQVSSVDVNIGFIVSIGITGILVGMGLSLLWLRRKNDEGDLTEGIIDEVTTEAKVEEGHTASMADYESLVRKLMQKAAMEFGPKLAKGAAVRNIVEERVGSFVVKAKNLVVSEMNDTAGSLCKAVDAEEAMLLLDWNAAIEANFPPCSILMAGFVAPASLSISVWSHIVQIFLVVLPVMILCIWSEVVDWNHPCSTIPTLRLWIHCMSVLCLILLVARLVMVIRIKCAQRELQQKSEEMRDRLANVESQGQGQSLNQLRELFVCHGSLLQHALVVENQVRASIFSHFVGLGELVWLFFSVWVIFICSRYTFVPGVVAFHPDASDSEFFCAAWSSVVTARITSTVASLFLFVHLAAIASWISELMLSTTYYSNWLVQKAKSFDDGNGGVPIAQLLLKAFVLKGSTDILSARLAVSMREKCKVAKEFADTEQRLADLKKQMQVSEKETAELCKQVEELGGSLQDQMQRLETSFDVDALKHRGHEVAEDAARQAMLLQVASTDELQKLIDRILAVAGDFGQSEAVQAVISQAEGAINKVQDVAGQAQSSEAFKSAQAVAGNAMEQVQSSEAFKSAQAVAGNAVEHVQSSEAFKSAQAAAGTAAEQVQSSEAAKSTMQNPKDVEKCK